MKIQRWSDRAGCGMTVNDEGRYVQFADIAHLLPVENPEWEPCEIGEATHVIGSNGGMREASCGESKLMVKTGDGDRYTNYLLFADIPFYGLTPVRRRKVEPVVVETSVHMSHTLSLPIGSLSSFKQGQRVRVTVEAIQGEGK